MLVVLVLGHAVLVLILHLIGQVVGLIHRLLLVVRGCLGLSLGLVICLLDEIRGSLWLTHLVALLEIGSVLLLDWKGILGSDLRVHHLLLWRGRLVVAHLCRSGIGFLRSISPGLIIRQLILSSLESFNLNFIIILFMQFGVVEEVVMFDGV